MFIDSYLEERFTSDRSEEEARQRLIDLPEKELVRYILNYWGTVYDFFNFAVVDALGPPPRTGWEYLYFAELPLADLGFPPGIQPGDIDVLIVPVFEGEPKVELAAAIEVKRLALRGPKWDKNVDRYGVRQAHGLLKCGFPCVGILHVIVNAPGPVENHRELEHWRVIEADIIERIGPTYNDLTGCLAAERQIARLQAQPIHPAVGLNAVAIANGPPPYGKVSSPPRGRSAQRRSGNPALLANLKEFVHYIRPNISLRPADLRRNLW